MNRRIFVCLIITCFFIAATQPIHAQSEIHGFIQNENGEPIASASVLLLKAADSSLVKGSLTDASGKYNFQNIQKGNYLLSGSFSGMGKAFAKPFEISPGKTDVKPEIIILKKSATQLADVKVDAKKPMYEQKIDRMVINVKNSIIDAGGTALDVLEKSPGVTVNRQSNSISMNGKSGLVVMINGKITYMPMEALIQFLAGINAGNIERIELITTPPAKYDAEGNAGYINIVLINNPFQGFNGSYYLTAGYGRKPLASGGINFNYRTNKVNLFGTYGYDYEHTISSGNTFTQLSGSSGIITTNSYTDRDATKPVHTARIGLDYQLDTSNIIGMLVSGYNSYWDMTANNGANVSKNNILDTVITTVNKEINHWQNLAANINFQHTFKPAKVLSFDANDIYYKDNNPNTYFNNYYNGVNDFLYTENMKSTKVTPINIKVVSVDYTTPIGKKITMEAGAKTSFSKFTNDISVQTLKGDLWIPDPLLSANYLLKENIGAAYTSFTMDISPKVSMKAGLRYEHTYSNLGTTTTANIVNRKYGELFPTFYISDKINENNSINFSYSRRITRPTFNDLAPFTIFFSPKLFFTGNAALQPAISNSVQASYSLKNYIFSLSYTYENNSIASFQTDRIDTINNTVYMTAVNLNYQKYLTASFSIPITVTKWWSMQNNINLDWKQINAVYQNEPVQLQFFDYNMYSTQSFKLPKDFSFELTGLYVSAGYFGTQKMEPIYQLDAGLQKKFSNKKDILRFTGNDMFNSGGYYRLSDNLPVKDAILKTSINFGMVAYKVTWTHNFGNKSLKGKRDRSTGAEDELNRVHN